MWSFSVLHHFANRQHPDMASPEGSAPHESTNPKFMPMQRLNIWIDSKSNLRSCFHSWLKEAASRSDQCQGLRTRQRESFHVWKR